MQNQQGFTTLELLIVIMVVGILSAIAVETVGNQLNASSLRQANSQVITDIERARSASLKTSKDSIVTIANDGRSYSLTLNDGSDVADIQLPGKVVMSVTKPNVAKPINMTKFTYTAPYATMNAMGLKVTLSVPDTKLSRQFYIMGVTGKVNQ